MDVRAYIIFVALATLATLFFSPLLAKAWKRMRAQGAAFSFVVAGFLVAMGTKPNVSWDEYLTDYGTVYTNNMTAVDFRWIKNTATVPDSTTVTISQKPNGGSTWTDVASTTVGAKYYRLSIASTNYSWYVWTSYVPPTPVHTNGVWLGNVLENTRRTNGWVIVNGQIIQNGKVIAP